MVEWFVLEVLVEVGKKGKKISYSELLETVNGKVGREVVPFNRAGLSRILPSILRRVCVYVYEVARVLPGSVVVSKSTGRPGKGYFRFLSEIKPGSSWGKELQEFYAVCREGKWG